jgi:probable rRNA maturation factor
MAEKVLAAARVEKTELSIILVSDRRMRTLNERYRKKNRATDVLAFPLAIDGAGQPRCSSRIRPQAQPPQLLGDVVIALSTAQRQAAALGHGLNEEVARLLVHGVLHLLGYDHEQGPREAARMIRQEHRLLRIVAAT